MRGDKLTGKRDSKPRAALRRTLTATAHAAKLTLVIYMGVSSVRQIGDELLAGLPADTPVAVIQHASLPHQRHALTTLGELPACMAALQASRSRS